MVFRIKKKLLVLLVGLPLFIKAMDVPLTKDLPQTEHAPKAAQPKFKGLFAKLYQGGNGKPGAEKTSQRIPQPIDLGSVRLTLKNNTGKWLTSSYGWSENPMIENGDTGSFEIKLVPQESWLSHHGKRFISNRENVHMPLVFYNLSANEAEKPLAVVDVYFDVKSHIWTITAHDQSNQLIGSWRIEGKNSNDSLDLNISLPQPPVKPVIQEPKLILHKE